MIPGVTVDILVLLWHLITRIGAKKDTRTVENTITSGRGGNGGKIADREKKKVKYLEIVREKKLHFLLMWGRNYSFYEKGRNIVRKAVAAR